MLDLIYPENLYCICCGDLLDSRSGRSLCEKCVSQINWTADNPFKNAMDDFCFDDLICCCIYGYFPRQIVHKFKLAGKKELARPIAEMMTQSIRGYIRSVGAVFDYICFVPCTKEKEKKRGYNQAQLLAKHISEGLNIPVLDCLVKAGESGSQRLRSGEERMLAQPDYAKRPGCEIPDGSCILLIDDVLTTGSTADKCSLALKNAGAQDVCVCVFASSGGPRFEDDG